LKTGEGGCDVVLPERGDVRDIRGDDVAGRTKQDRQERRRREATRSNKRTAAEPGAENRRPVAAFFTTTFHHRIGEAEASISRIGSRHELVVGTKSNGHRHSAPRDMHVPPGENEKKGMHPVDPMSDLILLLLLIIIGLCGVTVKWSGEY